MRTLAPDRGVILVGQILDAQAQFANRQLLLDQQGIGGVTVQLAVSGILQVQRTYALQAHTGQVVLPAHIGGDLGGACLGDVQLLPVAVRAQFRAGEVGVGANPPGVVETDVELTFKTVVAALVIIHLDRQVGRVIGQAFVRPAVIGRHLAIQPTAIETPAELHLVGLDGFQRLVIDIDAVNQFPVAAIVGVGSAAVILARVGHLVPL